MMMPETDAAVDDGRYAGLSPDRLRALLALRDAEVGRLRAAVLPGFAVFPVAEVEALRRVARLADHLWAVALGMGVSSRSELGRAAAAVKTAIEELGRRAGP